MRRHSHCSGAIRNDRFAHNGKIVFSGFAKPKCFAKHFERGPAHVLAARTRHGFWRESRSFIFTRLRTLVSLFCHSARLLSFFLSHLRILAQNAPSVPLSARSPGIARPFVFILLQTPSPATSLF